MAGMEPKWELRSGSGVGARLDKRSMRNGFVSKLNRSREHAVLDAAKFVENQVGPKP